MFLPALDARRSDRFTDAEGGWRPRWCGLPGLPDPTPEAAKPPTPAEPLPRLGTNPTPPRVLLPLPSPSMGPSPVKVTGEVVRTCCCSFVLRAAAAAESAEDASSLDDLVSGRVDASDPPNETASDIRPDPTSDSDMS